MPSHLHEALLDLFRNQPGLAPGLLRDALNVDLPPYTEAQITSADVRFNHPSTLYFDLVRAALSEAVKETLEAMKPANYEYQSDFARKYFAEGRAAGQAGLLLKLLQGRFGPLPESVVSRVRSAGIDELDHWGELLLSAESLEDVLR